MWRSFGYCGEELDTVVRDQDQRGSEFWFNEDLGGMCDSIAGVFADARESFPAVGSRRHLITRPPTTPSIEAETYMTWRPP